MPLVDPVAELSAAARIRFARQIRLAAFGELGQRRLAAARVLVLGAGGIGSPVITALAAAGVGTIGIVDADVVETSNLPRQTAHAEADVGRSKAESAAETARALGAEAIAFPEEFTSASADELLRGWHLVVDGFDTFGSRYVASDAAARAGIPHVWGSALGFDGQLSVFWAAAPGGGVTLRTLHPDAPDEADSCATVGVLGTVCATIGAAMAGEAIKLITGIGDPLLGRVLVHDGLDGSWSEIALHRDAADADGAATVAPDVTAGSITAPELRTALAGPTPPLLVDLREDDEARTVEIEGSVRMPMSRFDPAALPDADELVLFCASGARSRTAAELAARAGRRTASLRGGALAWNLAR
ncbi:ThiF family adenylyltransferase [Microbacteriaceae bacterium VKM Ac-2855]|nr:ThiF family adenylyltransferase [Microbacteriaceae bacterium VKM Ac-2855]